MTTVLFFRARTPDDAQADLACQYGVSWLQVSINEAIKRGYDVIDLYGEDATFEKLKDALANVDVAIMFGHGAPSIFTGYNLQVVLEACVNDQVMSGTISHFLSCSVGQQLLPSIIEKTGISTIGYLVDFQFMVDTSFTVEEDPFAEPFKDVTVTIVSKILDGATLKQVWDAGIAKCDEWIAKLWDQTGTDWAEVISCLQHDRDGMIALGDQESYVMRPLATPLPLLLIGLFLLTRS